MQQIMIKIREKAKSCMHNPKFLRKLCFYAFELMLFTYLPIMTFIPLCISYLSAELLLKHYYGILRAKGILTFLPQRLQRLLQNRSIFDLLCDLWFMPKLSQYLKAFTKPFFQPIDPEDAYKALEEFPPESRELITQKGIINILPNEVKEILVPSGTDVYNDSDSTSDRKSKQLKIPKKKFKEDRFQNQFAMPWTIISPPDNDSEQEFQSVAEIQKPPNTSVKWDNLEKFYKQVKSNITQRSPFESFNKIANLISNILHFQDKSQRILAINDKRLYISLAISASSLITTTMLAKRTRRIMMQAMIIIFYLVCAGISTTSLGLLIYKYLKKHRK
ncbi:hypothetical protein pb186bvf_018250 [Paramecium bursaria]